MGRNDRVPVQRTPVIETGECTHQHSPALTSISKLLRMGESGPPRSVQRTALSTRLCPNKLEDPAPAPSVQLRASSIASP